MLKRFHVWTTDFREFYVDAYSRHHAERKVAEILGIDGEAFAWCDGGDGEFALAQFDSCADRDTWLNQI